MDEWGILSVLLQDRLDDVVLFPVFVIGTPKFQDWVAISIKS